MVYSHSKHQIIVNSILVVSFFVDQGNDQIVNLSTKKFYCVLGRAYISFYIWFSSFSKMMSLRENIHGIKRLEGKQSMKHGWGLRSCYSIVGLTSFESVYYYNHSTRAETL